MVKEKRGCRKKRTVKKFLKGDQNGHPCFLYCRCPWADQFGNIYLILRNHFYYGQFEYPVGSGHWYTGKHTPIIDKELFDKVQATIDGNYIPKTESKEFAFTKLMTCGLCGSGISAEEKYKNLKDGTVAKYIYYGCTRFHNKDCKGGYLEEKQLLAQLLDLMDRIDLDKSGLRRKLEAEIERHKKFHSQIMGKRDEEYRAGDVDIRNYAKYLLKEGTIFEKRDLLGCLKSKIIIREKVVSLQDLFAYQQGVFADKKAK